MHVLLQAMVRVTHESEVFGLIPKLSAFLSVLGSIRRH